MALKCQARSTSTWWKTPPRCATWCCRRRPANDLCDQLADQASAAEVFYALLQMERKEYLCEEEPSLPLEQAAQWSAQGITPGAAAQRLAGRPVAVQAFGVDVQPLLDL